VAAIYFDTSALIRRYDRAEPGARQVRDLCRASHRHTLLISRLTVVEVASALNRKVREGVASPVRRDQAWRLFHSHLRDQYRLLDLHEPTYQLAERLLFAHPLRAYDAVQLATALRAAQLVRNLTADYRFCTADRAQAAAATGEGLSVELIS
jgi:predicted nucleic acid-binding protein